MQTLGKVLGGDEDLDESRDSKAKAEPTGLAGLLGKKKDETATQETGKPAEALGKLGTSLFTKVENKEKEDKEKAATEAKDLKFDEGEVYVASKEQQTSIGQCKYAISFWRLTKGGNPMQIKEYGFNGSPYDKKIHTSACGNFIYFFLQIKAQASDDSGPIKRCIILNIDTLREHQIFDFPDDFNGTFHVC